jgi:Transcription factor WhiB
VPDTTLTRRESFAGFPVSHRTRCLGRGEHMAVSRTPAPADPGPTAHTLDRAAARPPYSPPPVPFPDQALWARVIRYARCADSTLDPDQWFPVSAEADKARHEAAAAITVCTTCLVRTQCLELSLRHWDIGQHGVWGGLVPADRAALRRRRQPSTIPPGAAALTRWR